MFRRASVFAGTFDVEGAKAVGGEDAVEALAGLVDRSIVIAEPGSPARYRMLETLRSFGLEELRRPARRTTPSRGTSSGWCGGARTMARSALDDRGRARGAAVPAQPTAISRSRSRACSSGATRPRPCRWPPARGSSPTSSAPSASPSPVLDAALALEGGDDADRIEALRVRGALLMLQGDYAGARTCLGSAHALAERFGDEALARRVRVHLARASYLDGNPVAAGALLDGLPEALADAGERFGEGLALTVAGTIEFSYGDLETSIALLGRALAAFEECGDDYGITDVCYFLGFAQADAGEAAAAAATYERGLAAAGDALPVYAVWLHYALGKLELAQGDAAAGEARADACAAAARLGGASVSGVVPARPARRGRAPPPAVRRGGRVERAGPRAPRAGAAARRHDRAPRRDARADAAARRPRRSGSRPPARAADPPARGRPARARDEAPVRRRGGARGGRLGARERGPPRRTPRRCSARPPRSARPRAGRCCRRGGRRSTPWRRCSAPSTTTPGRSAARSPRARRSRSRPADVAQPA